MATPCPVRAAPGTTGGDSDSRRVAIAARSAERIAARPAPAGPRDLLTTSPSTV